MTTTSQKDKKVIGLRKAQSLLGKIIAMVEHDAYCIDVMQQTLAAMGLLRGVHRLLMEDHLHSCFLHAMQTGSNARKRSMVEEILMVSRLANK